MNKGVVVVVVGSIEIAIRVVIVGETDTDKVVAVKLVSVRVVDRVDRVDKVDRVVNGSSGKPDASLEAEAEVLVSEEERVIRLSVCVDNPAVEVSS